MPLDPNIVSAIQVTRRGWPLISAKLRTFAEEMELCLGGRLDAIRLKHEAKLTELDQAARSVELTATELNDILKIDGLPTLMRDSVFLVVFGVFEHHMAGLCDRIMRTGAVVTKPGGPYLHHSKDFLVNLAGFQKSAFGQHWEFLNGARCVRNCVAHEASILRIADQSAQAKAARQFVNRTECITLDGDRISLECGFLPLLIEQMDRVFSHFGA